MKKLIVLPVLAVAMVFVSACVRSYSTPPPPVSNNLAGTLVAIQATQAAIETVKVQLAQAVTATPNMESTTPTETPTPEMVFVDLLTVKENEDARWVTAPERDLMRPRSYSPLVFGRNEPYTRGDVAIVIGRMCLWETIEDPFGTIFSDLPLEPKAGANPEEIRQVEQNRLIARYSEELVQRNIYLFKDPAMRNLSHSGDVLSADEYRQWMELARNSPECGNKTISSIGGFELARLFEGGVSQYLPKDLVVIPCDNSQFVAGIISVIPWQWGKDTFVWVFDQTLEAVLKLPWILTSCSTDADCGTGYRCQSGVCQAYCNTGFLSGGVCCQCYDDGAGPYKALRCSNPPGGSGWWVDDADHTACGSRPQPPPPGPTSTPAPPTNTPVPPTNTPVPPTNTPVTPPTNTPRPPNPDDGGDDDKKESTRTPKPVFYPTATPLFCPDNAVQGGCGLTRALAAALLHQDLAGWDFPPNQLPPRIP